MSERLRKLELKYQIINKMFALTGKLNTYGLDDLEEISHRLDIVSQGYVEVAQ